MKKLLLKPGFESIFALSIAAIIGLPPMVFAQDVNKKDTYVKKRLEINIKNGDTVINGKNIKELSGKERDEALSLFEPKGDIRVFTPGDAERIILKRKKGKGDKGDIVIERRLDGDPQFFAFGDVFNNDSLTKDISIKIDRLKDHPGFAFKIDGMEGPDVGEFHVRRPFRGFGGRNTQNFNYTNTDDEGITTNISYRVSDAPSEKMKSIASTEKAELAVNGITLVPDFSTGNTTLTFKLAAKANADVTFKDSQGKTLWSAKAAGGSFNKLFALPLNGVYYLQVKQGESLALKRIVKED